MAEDYRDHRNVHSIKDLNGHFKKEIEEFFISYNEAIGRQFSPLSWHGPNRAKRLILKGINAAEVTPRADEPNNNGHANGTKAKPKAQGE